MGTDGKGTGFRVQGIRVYSRVRCGLCFSCLWFLLPHVCNRWVVRCCAILVNSVELRHFEGLRLLISLP